MKDKKAATEQDLINRALPDSSDFVGCPEAVAHALATIRAANALELIAEEIHKAAGYLLANDAMRDRIRDNY